MIDVAIIGAGELGGSLAHVLARREIVGRIQLIDPAGQVAAGKALDIMQAGPIEQFSTPVVGSADISRVAGAALVVVADPATPAAERCGRPAGAETALADRRRARWSSVPRRTRENWSSAASVNCGIARERLIGSAPEALAAAIRALVALQTNGSVRDVALTVLGVPPAQAIVNWDEATIGGFAATRVLDEPALRRLSAQVAALWPPGPHVLAHAASEAVAAVCGVSRRAISCFVAPDDSAGRRARCRGVTGSTRPHRHHQLSM